MNIIENKTGMTVGNYDMEVVRSAMTLFKAIPNDSFDRNLPEIAMASLEDCILRGFIFIDGEDGHILPFVSMPLFVLAEQQYGIDKEINNQTFWKSFERVRDMDPREYVMHQIAHYFSTYGMEMIGLKARTYVPVQDLDIPNEMLPFDRMTVIRLENGEEMLDLINHYALVTTAPSQTRIEQFKPLMRYLTIKTDDIKSFEFQVIKHDMDGTVPENPQTFLRYLLYRTIGSTLLIKNRDTRKAIKSSAMYSDEQSLPYELFMKADVTKLASIFFRYKPIFLAFKKYPGCAPIINRIRRLADQYHVPMSDVSVQNFMNLVLQERTSDVDEIIRYASNRELIKLANFLFNAYLNAKYDKNIPGVYSIRNGRTFVRADAPAHSGKTELLRNAHDKVYLALAQRLKETLRGKTFYIPDYINYAMPTSEKQFIGNIPWGTILTVPYNEAFTTGISWVNQHGERVDIDLHLNSATQHFGWNGGYTDGENIIYTGDQTDAPEPNGAAEAYYFKPGDEAFILSANLFSGVADMPYKMFMTARKPTLYRRNWNDCNNYTFNPAEAIFTPIPLKFNGNERDMTIGLFSEGSFYFYGGSVNKGIVPSANYSDFIKGLQFKMKNSLRFKDMLIEAGSKVLDQAEYDNLNEEKRKDVISLAPEDLTATTLLDIIDGTF